MRVDKLTGQQISQAKKSTRPSDFSGFIGQLPIQEKLQTAIQSTLQGNHTLGHILFSGESGYGKTTLANIVANQLDTRFIPITGYAFSKPAEMIAVLNTLQQGDILFIDEIHRLRPQIEEMLYIAMEDYCIDMVMPEGGSVRIPLQPFTLIGATTKLQSLSTPLKNRFIYKFHLQPYTATEHQAIIHKYLQLHSINVTNDSVLEHIASYFPRVPREIFNTCVQVRDWLSTQESTQSTLNADLRERYWTRSQLKKGGLSSLQQEYLNILSEHPDTPCGLKTLAARLGVHTEVIEQDLEPLLFQLGKIQKTPRGRLLTQPY